MIELRDTVRDERVLREVREALAASERERAVALACRALDDGLRDPLLFYLRSKAMTQQSRVEAAVQDLLQAVALAPADIELRIACATDLLGLQRPREAIVVLEEAVRLDSGNRVAHFNLAEAYETADDLPRATASFETTVALSPGHAVALARIAALALRMGDDARADDYADRALAINPNENLALCTKVGIALAANEPDRAETFVQQLLGSGTLQPDDRADIVGMLGDVRHGQKRYAEAFESYAASKAAKQRIFMPQFGQNEAYSFSSYAGWLADYFAGASQEQARGRADEAPESGAKIHAFVAGFPRSGTTLLENILAAHPEVGTIAEKPTMTDALRTFLSNDAGRAQLAALSGAEADNARRLYWQRVAEFGGNAARKVFVDENPFNTPWLAVAAKLFPRARVIFAVRDPRDVVLSCLRCRFRMSQGTYEFVSLERAANFYAQTMRLAEIYREKLGLAWLEVRNEALVENFETEAGRVCDFLGLTYADEMRDFATHAKTRTITSASAPQIFRGLNADGIGQWRHYANELAPVMPILAPWVEKFGYPAD